MSMNSAKTGSHPRARNSPVNSSSGSKTSREGPYRVSSWSRARAHARSGALSARNMNSLTARGGGSSRVRKNLAPEYDRKGPCWDGLTKHGHSQFRWRRGPLLGQGRFGSVFLAMNVENGELIAVKQVAVESLSDKRMLQREIALMRSMSMKSPNIVRCLATELVDGTFNIFMEYVSGGSLKSMLKEFGPLSEEVVCAYALQILTGLRTLHDAGIAHRDIKADNMLLADDGTVKLADFGSAKRISMSTMMMQTAGNDIRGSPCWMAPEVIRNEVGLSGGGGDGSQSLIQRRKSVDQRKMQQGWRRADVWSLGATIVELISGSPPFSHFDDATSAMYFIGSLKGDESEFPVEEFPANMDKKFGHDLLQRCFSIDPSLRPSCHELLIHPYLRK